MRLTNTDILATATNATALRQRTGTQRQGNVFAGPKLHAKGDNALAEAGQALEETFIKTLLETSEAFDMGEGGGASFTKDTFISAIANAVAHSGNGTGLGLMKTMIPSADRGAPAPTIPLSLPSRSAAKDTDLVALLVGGAGKKTSSFGLRHDPFTGEIKRHGGVDIGAKEGTKVSAAQSGTVIFAGERGGYGNAVEIQSQDGTKTLYAHLSAIAVEKGATIAAGAQIGAVGHTGRATGSHLHVEVKRDGHRVDPEHHLKSEANRVERHDEHQSSLHAAPSIGGAQ